MTSRRTKWTGVGLAAAVVVFAFAMTGSAYGHCDSMNGPVVVAAQAALKTGDFSKVQIWVGEDQEAELKQVFQKCLHVRQLGDEAKELANRYFFETAVRLHRQAEGMPYTGLKPAGPMPADIQAAEKALETGDSEVVTKLLVAQLQEQVDTWFKKALSARANRDQSVEAGRRWVDAYVKYVVYVHRLYQIIQADPAHGVGD